MFKPLNTRRKVIDIVKGVFKAPIQWEDRLKGRLWIDHAGTFQPQRWGRFDSNSCWVLGGALNSCEDQSELLNFDKQFSDEALAFFKKHGYIDSVGDFSFSERFIEILGGQKDNGGTSELAWQLIQKYGLIPRSILTYSDEEANTHYSQESFVADYFNPSKVTPEMLALGRESKKYLNIAYQFIGRKWTTPSNEVLKGAIQFAPLCVGIPIPTNVFNWNNTYVNYDGNTVLAHEVELHHVTNDGTRFISDQYNPAEKHLSPSYPLYIVTQGVVYSLSKPQNTSATPPPPPLTVEQSYLQKFWTSVQNFWNGISNPTPIG